MFFDLNVPLPTPTLIGQSTQTSKKGKQKQQSNVISAEATSPLVFTPAQIAAIEARIDLLVHLGYTVFALNQIVQTKVDSRTHIDWLQGLIPKLKKRNGVAILKRLTVVLDEESEKGNGVNPQNASLLSYYDILSLRPTTQGSFSQACLMYSAPSPQTAHIISVPVTLPRLPFHLRHTLIRTALKNGAVFEIDYAGAVGEEVERRSWWGGSREVMRVTKGKGVLISGGASEQKELRAPRDAANLVTLLGIPQNLSHDAITLTPKSLVLRAQTRKTYRAILSEPKLIIPQTQTQPSVSEKPRGQESDMVATLSDSTSHPEAAHPQDPEPVNLLLVSDSALSSASGRAPATQQPQGQKRNREPDQQSSLGRSKKKKKQ